MGVVLPFPATRRMVDEAQGSVFQLGWAPGLACGSKFGCLLFQRRGLARAGERLFGPGTWRGPGLARLYVSIYNGCA